MDNVQRTQSREIFLGPDHHDPDSCLCPENMSQPVPRGREGPELEIEARKFQPLSHERRYRELIKSIIQPHD